MGLRQIHPQFVTFTSRIQRQGQASEKRLYIKPALGSEDQSAFR